MNSEVEKLLREAIDRLNQAHIVDDNETRRKQYVLLITDIVVILSDHIIE